MLAGHATPIRYLHPYRKNKTSVSVSVLRGLHADGMHNYYFITFIWPTMFISNLDCSTKLYKYLSFSR